MSLNDILNHRLLFEEKEGRAPLLISQGKADIIRHFLKDRSATFFDLSDEKGCYSETLKKNSIRRVERLEVKQADTGKHWICDYGTCHTMRDGCVNGEWSAMDCGLSLSVNFNYPVKFFQWYFSPLVLISYLHLIK